MQFVGDILAQTHFLMDSGRLRNDLLALCPGQQIDSVQLDSFLPDPASLNATSSQGMR